MTENNRENQILLYRIKQGDERAFRRAYDAYHNELYDAAFKFLRTKEQAEDAVHDVFVKLWDNRKTLRTSGSLKGFLFTAVKNHVLNIIDSNKRELQRNIKFNYEEQRKILVDDIEIELADYMPIVNEAIALLPESRRRVFNLRYKEGLTSNEVAEYLDISVHTVKSQHYKAVKFIREHIYESLDDPNQP